MLRIDESRGVAEPLPGAALADRVLLFRARRSCPTRAIELHDERSLPVTDEEGEQ